MIVDAYCYTCKEVVARCWDENSGCSGGGHCMKCMGYNFDSPEVLEQKALRAAMEEADKVLTKTLVES